MYDLEPLAEAEMPAGQARSLATRSSNVRHAFGRAQWSREQEARGAPLTGLTFDTGALIALERRRQRIARVYSTAVIDGLIITVPMAVVSEWWRGRSETRARILRGVRIEPLDLELAKLAGEAMASVRDAIAVDALVMASAARRGDTVYTSDCDDLARLSRYFPTVRVLSV